MTNRLAKSSLFLTSTLLFCFILFSCENDEIKNNEHRVEITPQPSMLDTLLGDKILNHKTGEIRENNFESLLKIPKDQLLMESSLYAIEKLDAHHFILRPKKDYDEARHFNILIKTDDSRITDYFVCNDFTISDIKKDHSEWIMLLSDFGQTNTYWKSEQQIKIVKLDSALNALWTYAKNSELPLSGRSIHVDGKHYTCSIEVITGCHICFTVAELTVSSDGQFLSVKGTGKQNATQLSDSQLEAVFQ